MAEPLRSRISCHAFWGIGQRTACIEHPPSAQAGGPGTEHIGIFLVCALRLLPALACRSLVPDMRSRPVHPHPGRKVAAIGPVTPDSLCRRHSAGRRKEDETPPGPRNVRAAFPPTARRETSADRWIRPSRDSRRGWGAASVGRVGGVERARQSRPDYAHTGNAHAQARDGLTHGAPHGSTVALPFFEKSLSFQPDHGRDARQRQLVAFETCYGGRPARKWPGG